jgi:DNA-binding CsgD family transcriptional regulator
MSPKISTKERVRILLGQGKTPREIARKLGLSETIVYRHARDLKEAGKL